MEKDIIEEIDEVKEDQKEFNAFMVFKVYENQTRIKELERTTTGLIILQGLCALTLLIKTIWG